MEKIKTAKKFLLFALVFVLCLSSLTSCALGDLILSSLGFDTYDYEGESVISTPGADDEKVAEICEAVKMLSVNDPCIYEFESAGKAVSECRDAVLNYMLCTSFSKYTGNPELLNEAAELYPEFRIISLIPAVDLENFAYTYFGDVKLTHESGKLFSYLEKAEAYSALTVPIESGITVSVISCEETEKTYRLTFQNSLGDVVSPVYRALVIKREDGSFYFKKIVSLED